MRKGIIVWHYTDLVCISRGYRINHSCSLWTLLWYSSENKPFWLKAKVSPMTDIPQQCAFSNTVLPPSAFAKSYQVLRYVNSSGIISWGEEEDEEEDLTQSYNFWRQDFCLWSAMFTTDTQVCIDKLSINSSGLKYEKFSFERQPNAVTPHAHTPVCGQTFTLFHPKKSIGVTTQKMILMSYDWLIHPAWFLFWLS